MPGRPKFKYKPKPPKSEGRPRSFNEDVIKKLEQAFSIGCSISEACLFSDITPQTFYNHVRPNTPLFDRFMALRERPILKARSTVVGSLNDPNHAKWYLERKKKEEFAPKSEVDANVTLALDQILDEIEKSVDK